jgi:hypothetical protein
MSALLATSNWQPKRPIWRKEIGNPDRRITHTLRLLGLCYNARQLPRFRGSAAVSLVVTAIPELGLICVLAAFVLLQPVPLHGDFMLRRGSPK